MAVKLARDGVEWSLSLVGAVGIADAATLHAYACEVLTGSNRGVVVRMQDVTVVDTAITQILLVLNRDLARDGRACTLQGAPDCVIERWRLSGLEEHLDRRVGP